MSCGQIIQRHRRQVLWLIWMTGARHERHRWQIICADDEWSAGMAEAGSCRVEVVSHGQEDGMYLYAHVHMWCGTVLFLIL